MKLSAILLFALILQLSPRAQQAEMINVSEVVSAFSEGANDVLEQRERIPSYISHRDRLVTKGNGTSMTDMLPLVQEGYALAEKVRAHGNSLTIPFYQTYMRELRTILRKMNKLQREMEPSRGEPKPGTLGECWKSCDDAVGSGFGGGKGWNRFACKSGCIITKLPPGS